MIDHESVINSHFITSVLDPNQAVELRLPDPHNKIES